MRAKEEAFRILEAALSLASSGVDEAEVALAGGTLGRTRFSDNQVQPAQEVAREVVSIRAAVNGRIGRVITSDMSTAGIKEAAQQLRVRGDHLPERVEGTGLPPPQGYEEGDAFDPESGGLDDLDREYLASRAVLSGVRNNLTASGEVCVQRGPVSPDGRLGLYAIANTRGLLAYHAARGGFGVYAPAYYRARGVDGVYALGRYLRVVYSLLRASFWNRPRWPNFSSVSPMPPARSTSTPA